ncbi:MAG: aminotransferase class I/II-fold pyridoxal phosphate-dependent enzyme [Leptolyngbya sp. PLA3]|nr:MAG: aminotransferase class I/II-fold pyridoxal phosphate-dependent enzyme [Cyanobacteria bacterium CYA]MCE7968401.1 aminotransferase class I/II-fold pyridoxal phosphate-dependent enzyme [Leptolyngbya sp. PL-A3]
MTTTSPFHAAFPVDFDTICTAAGRTGGDGDPLVPPLVQSTTYCRDGIASAAPHAYSRVSNPTVAQLEATLGTIEAAPPAIAFGTGLAAETALFLALLKQGDHIVCGQHVYGGTSRLLRELFADLGVETTFVNSTKVAEVAAAIRKNTRLVFVETPANPTLEITDIAAIAKVTHAGGALLAVDNTFLTGVLQQPLALGADLSVYSTTKFIEGHSVALGGAIVTQDAKLVERIKFIRKCTGNIQAPFNAWLTLQGIRTLPLRLRQQSATAAQVAEFLADHPAVQRACYPTLGEPRQRALADKQHLGAHGPVVSFEIVGGIEAAKVFLSALRLCRLVEHVGSVETLVTHSASMTHADVPAEERRKAGVNDGLVRISAGLESAEAIIADLRSALDAALECAGAEAVAGSPREEVAPCLAR